jgi:hypothetical protein
VPGYWRTLVELPANFNSLYSIGHLTVALSAATATELCPSLPAASSICQFRFASRGTGEVSCPVPIEWSICGDGREGVVLLRTRSLLVYAQRLGALPWENETLDHASSGGGGGGAGSVEVQAAPVLLYALAELLLILCLVSLCRSCPEGETFRVRAVRFPLFKGFSTAKYQPIDP